MQELIQHIQKIVGRCDVTEGQLTPYFEEFQLKKKALLNPPESIAEYNYFIVKGCVHQYYITPEGNVKTVQFALENWWITDPQAFNRREETPFGIQAIEACSVLAINKENEDKLLANHPVLERYFRKLYQTAFGASLHRFKKLQEHSKEEHYFAFIEHFPGFAQRVPQYLIASYLGLTPEYVSEIRKKRFS